MKNDRTLNKSFSIRWVCSGRFAYAQQLSFSRRGKEKKNESELTYCVFNKLNERGGWETFYEEKKIIFSALRLSENFCENKIQVFLCLQLPTPLLKRTMRAFSFLPLQFSSFSLALSFSALFFLIENHKSSSELDKLLFNIIIATHFYNRL